MKKFLLSLILIISLTSFVDKSDSVKVGIKDGAIINLYDAFGKDTALIKDFGFSCITKYRGQTILFDAGSNADIFMKNTRALGIDLSVVDIVVVSHGHFDHLNGIDYLLKVNPQVKIYFPYDIFWGAPVPFDATGHEPGVKDSLPVYMQYFDGGNTKIVINQSGRFWNANIEYIKSSKEILPGVHVVATTSPYLGYYSCYPGKSFVEGHFTQKSDSCKKNGLPELSLSMKTDKGQVLIVGCSHTGIEKIAKETQTVTKDKLELIYGGFHMLPFDRQQTIELANNLKSELNVHRIAPTHCTGHLAFKILQEKFGKDYLYAGLGETTMFE